MMQTLIIKIKNTENLEFIVQLLSKFSFVTEIKKEKSNKKNKYDFSDIAGKLEWTGNALDEQKKLKKKKQIEENERLNLNLNQSYQSTSI